MKTRVCLTAAVLTAAIVAAIWVAAPAGAARSVTIRGGGWGHGIGMSQYGAYGRAKNGVGAHKILRTYYSHTSVRTTDMPYRLRVGLLQGRNSISLSSLPMFDGDGHVEWELEGLDRRLASGDQSVAWRVEPSSTGGMRLYKNDKQVKRDGVGVWGGPELPLVLVFDRYGSLARIVEKNNNYGFGAIELDTYSSPSCSSGYCLRAVLSVSMQEYLYGLGEVPSSWPRAVLEAQAIAGRTYALDKVNRSGQNRYPCACAVFDSVLDQAYIGDAKRTGSGDYWDDWKGAVDATDAQVILYEGDPIQALYSSTSGGYTEHNENVWGGTPLPYLRGVRDDPDKVSPYHEWTLEMSWDQFSTKLAAAFDTGRLKRFSLIKPFGVSGRVTVVQPNGGGVRIVGSQDTARVSGWSVRSALGLRDTLFRVDIDHSVAERFAPRYRRLDGAPGEARGPSYPIPRKAQQPQGRAQDFHKGRMTFIPATDKVVWQHGVILKRYDALGRELSALGLPASDIWGPGDYLGATYANGIIVWTRPTDAHSVRGSFYGAFHRAGGIKGALGVPIGERKAARALPGRGKRQRFDGGTVYSVPGSGTAFALWGAIERRYREMGEARSRCGYPTADMVADGSARAEFQNGLITWSPDEGLEVACS